MNITDSIQSFFGGDGAARLGQVAGLDTQTAQRVLSAGLPLQLDALAEHARGAQGQAQIAEAIQNLPQFGSVQEALDGADGPQNLQQAGDLLGSVLLGDRAANLGQTVAAQTGAAAGGVQKMLGMALPLLLSQLGRAGVNGGNVGGMLGGLKGQLGGLLGAGAGAAALGGAALGGALGKVAAPDLTTPHVTAPDLTAPSPRVPDIAPPAVNVPLLDTPPLNTPSLNTPVPGAAGAATMGAAAGLAAGMSAGAVARDDSAAGLLEFLKGQFSGPAAERIGTSAGFGGGASRRAAQAALPLILNSLVNRGRTEAGAQDVLNMARPFEPLADTDGHLNTAVLDDAAESARIEGQGRGLLGGLFGNVDQVAGRLGTALGGSGASAGRLLALMTPLVLGVLGNRARSGGLGAAGFSGVLGGMGTGLAGLLPSGLSSLGGLLGAGGLAAGTAAAMAGAPRPAAPPVAPAPVPPAGTPPTPPEEKRRGGFPWWIIPLLLLLLLGGCWLVNRPSTDTAGTATTATDAAASILVTNPSSDANLPPQPFTMSGTGPAGATLTIQDEGQDVGTATVGDDGNWSADLPAPTVGEHTYTVDSGSARSEFKVNITEGADGAAPADDTSGATADATDTDTAGTDAADTSGSDTGTADAGGAATPAAFAISVPTADQELPAGGFTMNGTGTPGEEVELFEDGTSLGKVTIGEDGTWTFDVPSPAAGAHTYSVNGPDGTELGTVSATIAAASADASAADCTEDYTLSITDGQTVSEPFRFGGVGQGEGYSVTVKRGDRTIGTKAIPLDATCGWSYQSRPGAGTITYEVRPTGDAAAEPLSSVTLTVGN